MDAEEEKKFIKETVKGIARSRSYADSFECRPERDLEEYSVVKLFCEALEKEGKSFIDSSSIFSRGRGNDPPDCEANDHDGNLIGIEVTELVDPHAIAASNKDHGYDWAEWDKTKLIDAISDRLEEKDIPGQIKGGPYTSYILIIYTDEPVLNAGYAKALLKEYRFSRPNLISKAFLFIFFDPLYKTYPCIELEFGT